VAQYPTPLASSLRDVRAAIVFRFLAGLIGGVGFHVFRDLLPFPHPQMALLCASVVVYNCLLVPTLWIRDVRKHYLLHEGPAYTDMSFTLVALHFTGGYLSPFIVTPLLTVWGLNSAYLPSRGAGSRLFGFFIVSLIGMTILHKTGIVPVPVEYAARLIASTPFFIPTFFIALLLQVMGFALVRSTSVSVDGLFTDFLTTTRNIVSHVDPSGDRDPLPKLAATLQQVSGTQRVLIARVAHDSDPVVEPTAASALGFAPGELERLVESRTLRCLAAGATMRIDDLQSEAEPDPVLHELGVRGFWGSSLEPGQPRSTGVLCLLDDQPLWFDPKTELVTQMVAVVARAELHRQRHDRERRSLQERVHQSQKLEALGQLAGGVAHDFNNLLTAIVGHAELIALDARSAARHDASQILNAATQAADLVSQLLAFSRAGPVAQSPVRVDAVVKRVVELLHHTLDRSIEMVTNLDAKDVAVIGDASQLQTALLNVAVNARDAMPDGGEVRFETTVKRTDELGDIAAGQGQQPDRYAVIQCRDSGSGMTPDVLDRAFEPFFTTKPLGKGTGLGLASVYGIVKRHGGTVRLRSAPGEGTTVTVYLPVREATGETVSPPEVPAQRSPRSGQVVVVDDEPAVLRILTQSLRRQGFAVHASEDGVEALEHFRRQHDDVALVVLDVLMPKITGPDLYRQMMAERPGLKCLFVTGYAEHASLATLVGTPDCAVLAKPFRAHEFEAAVATLIDAAD
jgi:signal transduction histidine kinase/CheY-like chemotaxis protein